MVQEKTKTEIIRTKLHRPQLPKDHIHRPRLLKVLNDENPPPLTLVAAPAGYGKSTMISCWLESCNWPSAWVSFDESDNHLQKFLIYFLHAIATIAPDALGRSLSLLHAPQLPPLSNILTEVVNDLEHIDQDFFLVMDDFHCIKDRSIQQFISDLLHHSPHSLHLVVICRRYPFMPLATIRAQDRLREIGIQDLCFTEEETRQYLEGFFGEKIDDNTAKVWTQKTEGWVTALRLGAISMGPQSNLNKKLVDLDETTSHIMEYFLAEVISQLPQKVKNCLMELSILDRFCAPLCEAMCSPNGKGANHEEVLSGKELINFLLHANLFLIPLDSQNSWFRLHHLFQKLMQEELKTNHSPSKIKKLHSRASKWYDQNGFREEAIQHALAASDVSKAIRLVARHGYQLMDDQQWQRLERWLGMLPRDSIKDNPDLLLLSLWSNHMRTAGFDVSVLADQLEKIENLISTSPPNKSDKVEQIRSHCYAQRSYQHLIAADGKRALKYARLACEHIPIHHKRTRLRAHFFQVVSFQMIGELETGLSIFYDEVNKNPNLSSSDQSHYLANLCFVYWADADLITLLQISENTLKIAMNHQAQETISFSLYYNGLANYHQNNLQSAEENLGRLVNDFYMYFQLFHTHGSFCLSLTYQAQGQPDKAIERNKKMMEYAIETGNQRIFQITRAFEAELALRQGRLQEASIWAERYNPKPFPAPFGFYMPQLTLVRILLAQNTTNSLHQADELLNQLNDFFESIYYKNFRIQVLALQALSYEIQGKKMKALKKLAEALNLAEPSGFIRLFVDLGPQMIELLKKLARKKISKNFIGKILLAFGKDEQKALPGESIQPTPNQPSLNTPVINDLLTNREMEILEKLAERMRDKEIAAQLNISAQTVNSHLKNIYGKLNANNRIEVVSIAKERGVLK